MKTAFPDILANLALRERLSREIQTDKLSHAYILSGPDGSGKHTLALRMAAALACENRKKDGVPLPCMSCPSCRKILGGKSPDVIYVKRQGDRATLGVEAIRFLREDVYIAPNDTETKIYILEDAETMTPQAQNAFLLTLEEPPAYVLFLLLCKDTENLLETVRSRAPVLRLESVPPEEIRAYLACAEESKGISGEELSGIVAAAGGSIGRALELLHPEERKPLLARRELVRRFLAANSAADYAALIPDLGVKRDEVLLFLCALSDALCDLLALRKSEQTPPLYFYDSAERAEASAGNYSAFELSALCRAVSDATDRINRNANVRLTLTKLGMDAGLF